MNRLYHPSADYCGSPMSFANVPDLIHSYDDISTDPSPSPPMMFASLDNQYNNYPTPVNYPAYLSPQQQLSSHSRSHQSQPRIVNSIEFTDLTHLNREDSNRQRRRSTTLQDKEATSNMRIRRRAQNRASQRAFRERKEKHVQHLEHELEVLEGKHNSLERSYTEVEGAHARLKREVEALREELSRLRVGGSGGNGGAGGGFSRESSAELKWEDHSKDDNNTDFFDPFAGESFFAGGGGGSSSSGGEMGF